MRCRFQNLKLQLTAPVPGSCTLSLDLGPTRVAVHNQSAKHLCYLSPLKSLEVVLDQHGLPLLEARKVGLCRCIPAPFTPSKY